MTEHWDRLADEVSRRRAHLKLSQRTVSARGGPSDVVQSRIERNEIPHPRYDTVHKLDAALEWQPGSAAAVLAGGTPRPVEQPASLEQATDDELIAEIRRRMKGARHAAHQAEATGTPTEAGEDKKTLDGTEGDGLQGGLAGQILLPGGVAIPPKDQRKRRPK